MPPEEEGLGLRAFLNPPEIRIPDELVELHLNPDREAILQRPISEVPKMEITPYRGENEGSHCPLADPAMELAVPNYTTGPVVVCPILEDELHFVPIREVVKVGPEILALFPGAGTLQVHDLVDSRVQWRHVYGSGRLYENGKSSFQEFRSKSEGVGVDQGFATGDLHQTATEALYPLQDPRERGFFPTVEGVLGVTPDAAKGASSKSNERAREPSPGGLSLNGVEDLGDAKVLLVDQWSSLVPLLGFGQRNPKGDSWITDPAKKSMFAGRSARRRIR